MKKYVIGFICFNAFLFSCTSKKENNAKDKATVQDSIAPLKVTVLDDLPDRLQPNMVYLDKMPRPKVVAVSKNGGDTKMLPVLQNEKGAPILDLKGQPMIMGDGGKSNFTNFTTDDGLVLDGISCSVMDKTGNLWFGTNGGGVSRYDGKSFTSFTIAQGLTNNFVTCITEDKSGNLWFGTYGGGVSRYNGKYFTSFTTGQGLANNVVYSIMEDKNENLWFGTYGGGVSRYDGKRANHSCNLNTCKHDLRVSQDLEEHNKELAKSFTSFTTAQGLANNMVWCINEDTAGNLWFGTNGGGVSRYDGKRANHPCSMNTCKHDLRVRQDLEEHNKELTKSFTSFTTTQGLTNNIVWCINKDKAGNLWFGTDGGGVSRYDGISFANFTTDQGLANNHVASITEDKYGNLWFGTYGGGVSRYDGKSFASFTTAQGLSNNYVNSITEDKTGYLWFGTIGGGVSRYAGKSFNSFTTTQGLANNIIWCINEDKKGNFWFGTNGGGVSRYDGKSFTNFTTAQGLAHNIVLSIHEDKSDNLWFGTNGGGVSRYDGKSFTTFTTAQGLAKNSVNSITEDLSGNLWFGTNDGGVSRYNGNSFTNFNSDQGLANNNVRCILKDKTGNLWFSTRGGGISRYDGQSFISFTTTHGLANNVVYSITQDKIGNLWFGTAEGLSLMSKQQISKLKEKRDKTYVSEKIFKSFTISDGLPHNSVTQVMQLPDGKMAVGTNLGISLFSVSKDLNKLINIQTYNTKTGDPLKDVNVGQNCMILDSKGIIWAGTGSEKTALVRFDYKALMTNKEAPNLVIQSIKVNDENISWYDLSEKSFELDSLTSPAYVTEEVGLFGRALDIKERDSMQQRFGNIQFDGITLFNPIPLNLVLPYEHNQISFEYAAIETGKPFLVKYQYKLEGYDKDWSQITDRSSASFGNINEGNYTFKLKAQGANGIWCDPVTYTFKVLPPWYRTWLAYLAYIVSFLLALRIFIKWRERLLIREKQILEGKVNTRTSELNESLENLKATQSQLIQSEKMASLGELTAGIAHEIQNPLNFVNNFSEVSNELISELKVESSKVESERDKGLEDELLNDIAQNLTKINHHGKRASDIVKGMLEHSRTNTGQKEATDINALCDDYLRLAYQGLKAKNKDFNATMETHFDLNLPKIEIIPQDIGRVILNLTNNAFYAVSEKLKVESEKSGSEYEPKVTITTQLIANSQQPTANSQLQITIKDNGSGIPEHIKDKIFQPFFTTKPTGQGTGLGLSLSYDIVKAHGGELTIESQVGEGLPGGEAGTAFIIQIPTL